MNQNVISRVWGIQFDTPDLTLNITTEDVEEWNKQARDILQERAPLAAVDTKASSIDYEEVTRQYEDMRAVGLDFTLNSSLMCTTSEGCQRRNSALASRVILNLT